MDLVRTRNPSYGHLGQLGRIGERGHLGRIGERGHLGELGRRGTSSGTATPVPTPTCARS